VWWPGGVSGHAWLRVRIGAEEQDVCPGSVENTPGHTQFRVLSPVLTWSPWLRPFTHVGSSIENMRRDLVAQWQARRSGAAIRRGAVDRDAGRRTTMKAVVIYDSRFGNTERLAEVIARRLSAGEPLWAADGAARAALQQRDWIYSSLGRRRRTMQPV
jgi:hypothetical protein